MYNLNDIKQFWNSNPFWIGDSDFEVEEAFLHFSLAIILPLKILVFIHKYLDRIFGFVIYVKVKKK